jgi:hypothetical protein
LLKGITVYLRYIGTDLVMEVIEKIPEQIVAQIPNGRLFGTHELDYLVGLIN